MKSSLAIIYLFLILLIITSCSKDKTIDRYLGKFNFRIITNSWRLGISSTSDTTFYDGEIRRYNGVNSDNKIVIDFGQTITSDIDENGVLTYITNHYHFAQFGRFVNINTIQFGQNTNVGLAAGSGYNVIGVRK